MSGILIFAETDQGQLHPGFWELVTVGRELAPQLDDRLQIVVQGWEIEDIDAIRRSGADAVYRVEDPRLAEPWPDAHLAAFSALCRELQPALVLMPRTLLGMELAARLAYRFESGVVQDATRLEVNADGLVATRPVFGGAVLATVRLARQPWIVVPRPRAFAPAKPEEEPRAELVSVQPELAEEALKTAPLSRTRQQDMAQNLERARVIIAGGRGLGGPEPFQLLREIAELVDGAVGASRPPCDSGWVDPALQIGLTGKTVAPDVYIAVGISGATQHMSGCSASQVIVAINKDPEAPIFRMATYGVVGEWEEVLPAFRDALKEMAG
jgi:electron transfer flavoprotein alpha subunit